MFQPTFMPVVASSIPQTRLGEVSNRSRMSAAKVSFTAFRIVARSFSGSSNALRTSAGSPFALSALASRALSSSPVSRNLRVNTSPKRSSRLVVARSPSAFRAMAKTSSWVRPRIDWPRVWASARSASCRFAASASAACRAAARSRVRSAAAASVASFMSAARWSSRLVCLRWRSRRSFSASAFWLAAASSSAAIFFSRVSMAWRIGL